MIFDYTSIPGAGVSRPLIYGRLLNSSMRRWGLAVPMIIDTGSDRCLFDARFAHEIGIDPVAGGWVSRTTGVGGAVVTALWPIDIEFPQLRVTLRVDAEFTNALPIGANGLLGNMGFLDRFSTVCFRARERSFSIEA